MTAAQVDPDRPWLIAEEHYETAYGCPLPAPGLQDDREGSIGVRWVVPGTTWRCPECGLVYVAARTDRHTSIWISTGTDQAAL